MSYNVYGFIKDSAGNPLSGVKVMPYFEKVDSGSDPSKWADNAYTTDGDGYYGYSPEDVELLDSTGSYRKGTDKFICAFMYGGGANVDALDMEYATLHVHVIPNADDSEINLTLDNEKVPIIDASVLPDAVLTQHEYEMSETSHTDETEAGGQLQAKMYDGVSMFSGHMMVDTEYSWGEIATREVANSTSDRYTYVDAGDYELKVKVREKWETNNEVVKNVRVKYNEPVMNFEWNPTETSAGKIKGQEEIEFVNTSTCLDDRLVSPYEYKWEIADENQDGSDNSSTVSNAAYGDKPTKRFQSEGNKVVRLTCYWNDGFDDQVVQIEKTVEVYPFTVEQKFTWNNPIDRDVDVELKDTTVDSDSKVNEVQFYVNDYYETYNPDSSDYGNSEVDNAESWTGLVLGDSVVHKFQSKIQHEMKLRVKYYDGWKDVWVEKVELLVPTEHVLDIAIGVDPDSGGYRCYGKNEHKWKNVSTGSAAVRQIEQDWTWDDAEVDGTSHVESRTGQGIAVEQPFTFQYVSRKPYSAINGATASNHNKPVKMDVLYDNGWNNVTRKELVIAAEASTYEVQGSISYDANKLGYTHG